MAHTATIFIQLFFVMVFGYTSQAASSTVLYSVETVDDTNCRLHLRTNRSGIIALDLFNLKPNKFTVDGTEPSSPEEIYTWSPCEPITISSKPPQSCVQQLLIYEDKADPICVGMGNMTKYEIHKNEVVVKPHNKGSVDRNTDITLRCDGKADIPKFECNQPSPLHCTGSANNHFILKSKLFCFDGLKPEPTTQTTNSSEKAVEPNKKSGSGRNWVKLSMGSIILITSGSVFTAYLILGLAYGTGRGEKGFDRLPNSDFWLELPRLVRDGAKFLSSGCKPSYTPLPMMEEDTPPEPVDV